MRAPRDRGAFQIEFEPIYRARYDVWLAESATAEYNSERFAGNGLIDNGGIASSLQKKLDQVSLAAFRNEVEAQSGKHIDGEAAKYLLRDAEALIGN